MIEALVDSAVPELAVALQIIGLKQRSKSDLIRLLWRLKSFSRPCSFLVEVDLRCTRQVTPGAVCGLLRQTYGTTVNNPGAYMARSLLSFTNGHLSDILHVQGLQDSPIQMASWPTFKQQLTNCTNCQNRQSVEIANGGHTSLFESPVAINAYNVFINR